MALKFEPSHNSCAFLDESIPESLPYLTLFEFLRHSRISFAISANPSIYLNHLSQFWATATFDCEPVPPVIRATVAGQAIMISEETVRSVLQFGDSPQDRTVFPNLLIRGCFQRMGYSGEFADSQLRKAKLSPNWRDLMHILIMCISSRKAGYDGEGHVMQSAMVALTLNKPYNFSKYVFDFLKDNIAIRASRFLLFGICCEEHEIAEMAERMQCKTGSLPFVYLGLMVGANMRLYKNWKTVIDTVEARLSLWKANTLSIGGRVTLLKSVLECLPVYYFSLFKAPIRVINKIDGLRKRFLWGGSGEKKKIHWIAWEQVIKSRDCGGLGLSPLLEFNLSLLGKWHWRFKTESGRLWHQVIVSIHNSSRSLCNIPFKCGAAGIWKSIANLDLDFSKWKIQLSHLIKGEIGNGENLRFWIDNWEGSGPLRDLFPEIFKLEANKKVKVAARLPSSNNQTRWRWKRRPNSTKEKSELDSLNRLVHQKRICDGTEDRWRWGNDQNGFTVKALRGMLMNADLPCSSFKVLPWNKRMPLKINIFGWRALQDRLPSKLALSFRNVNISNVLCSYCNEYEESIAHLLTGCSFSMDIWKEIGKWCKIPNIFACDVKDLLFLHENIQGTELRLEMIHIVMMTTCWCIWKARNLLVYNQRRVSVSDLIKDVKTTSYMWIKHRSYSGVVSEEQWLNFSFP